VHHVAALIAWAVFSTSSPICASVTIHGGITTSVSPAARLPMHEMGREETLVPKFPHLRRAGSVYFQSPAKFGNAFEERFLRIADGVGPTRRERLRIRNQCQHLGKCLCPVFPAR
jgi:hypothetical protein